MPTSQTLPGTYQARRAAQNTYTLAQSLQNAIAPYCLELAWKWNTGMLTDAEIMAQVFAAFQAEQAEHRQAAGELLLELERNPRHPQRQQLLEQLFREAHSLKGGARAAGQLEVEQLAHRIEDVFSAVRQGQMHLTPDICDPIYAALDAIGAIMEQAVAGQPISLEPYEPLLARLRAIVEPGTPAVPPDGQRPWGTVAADMHDQPSVDVPTELPAPISAAPPIVDRASQMPDPHEILEPSLPPQSDALASDIAHTTVRLSTTILDNLLSEADELMTCTIRARQHARDLYALTELSTRWRQIWRTIQPVLHRLQSHRPMLPPTIHHLQQRALEHERQTQAITDQDALVLLDTLRQVNTLMTELDSRLTLQAHLSREDHARLAAVTDRMHDQIRHTRMLPLRTLLHPLHLQLREMARTAGKNVLLELDDGGAEADRQVLERLREVLLHLLRNAVDHGVEPPEVRAACGKPATSCIKLCAAVSEDHLTLWLTDDGAGLDTDAIRHQAIQNGLLSETDVARMSEADLHELIFLPGFSTRQTVSNLSGRGVGLDIVRSQIERMNGRVTIQSIPGIGTTFTIHVPLSLTSSHGLLLHVGAATYVLPLDAVQRIVQVDAQTIQVLEGRAVLMIEQRPMTLVSLAELLGEEVTSAHQHSTDGMQRLALILGSAERQVACLVDDVLGEQELVVHRLPPPLQRVRFIAGATLLADGRVIPILDMVDIVRAAIGIYRTVSIRPKPSPPERHKHILVVDDSITTRTLEKNILEAAGYTVSLATDGVEALDVLRRLIDNGGCDLLLSDIDMPRLNGFDLTTQIRADTRLRHLPVVLVTSLDTPADRERGIAAGADAYIVKRLFDQHMLLDTIAQLV